MSAEHTANFGIPKEAFTTGIADARTFNAAMDKVDELLESQKTKLDVKDSVDLATAAALLACTAAGSGAGKTLTADAVGTLTVDGIATALGDRILVKDQVAGKDNGIYKVTTLGAVAVKFVLTRATDADENVEVNADMFVFVEEGTANADSGFVLTTDDPIVLDTTALVFAQYSGAGQITAGDGLVKTGNTIDVDLHATPGLEFAGTKLRAKIDPTPGTQANPHLAIAADGLGILGLPPLFEVDDVAVGVTVTAANLDTLTDTSNADALHVHTLASGLSDVSQAGAIADAGAATASPAAIMAVADALTASDPTLDADDITDSSGGTPSGTHAVVPMTAIGGSGATTAQEADFNNNMATIAAEYNSLKDDVEANETALELAIDDLGLQKAQLDQLITDVGLQKAELDKLITDVADIRTQLNAEITSLEVSGLQATV